MSTVDEAVTARTPLGSDLEAGVQSISLNQTIVFTQYVRVVLPVDGFAFWVKADQLSTSALLNAFVLNGVAFDQAQSIVAAAKTLTVQGSLHFSSEIAQEEPETYARSRVVFTSLAEVKELAEIAPNQMWLGSFGELRFGFSSLGSFYRQADLWHYVGFAVFSDMTTQIVDDARTFNSKQVVSNSLPFWLGLSGYQPTTPAYGFGNSTPLYPSFIVPENITPPFGAIHIESSGTRGLQSAPRLDRTFSHSQLCADRVRITLWGLRNDEALDFLDCVMQRSTDYDDFGIMNVPVVRDEKRTQAEMNVIAQKKVLDFEVSYYQSRANNMARQMIDNALVTYLPQC